MMISSYYKKLSQLASCIQLLTIISVPFILIGSTGASGLRKGGPPNKREAYVALFYGRDEGFLLGMRVLGQSLRDSGTNKEMVALCLPDVGEDVKLALVEDGWVIVTVNPEEINYQGPFAGHVAKLSVLTLTEYSKVVLIDTDVIAYENCDDIFGCGEYCAVMRHSNMFNSGVMVLTPSSQHFANILSLIQTWDPLAHSHKGGDQDILNHYFNKIIYAPTFNKSTYTLRGGQSQQLTYSQLPFEYNMDAGMYYLRDEWLIERRDFRFLHYTFGAIRPWQWVTYPLFDLNWRWQKIRSRLKDPYRDFFTPFSAYLPFYGLILLAAARLTTFTTAHSLLADNKTAKNVLKTVMPGFSRNYKLYIFAGLILAVFVSWAIIPTHMSPLHGWVMFLVATGILWAHVFEFTYLVFHYGHGSQDRPFRNFKLYETHLKVALFLIFYVVASLCFIIQLRVFSLRVKTAVLLGILLTLIISKIIDHLVPLYVQYLPRPISPAGTPIKNFEV